MNPFRQFENKSRQVGAPDGTIVVRRVIASVPQGRVTRDDSTLKYHFQLRHPPHRG